MPLPRRLIFAASAAGVLWLVTGAVNAAFAWHVYVGRALGLFLPSPTKALFWSWAQPWGAIALIAAALAVGSITYLIVRLVSRRGAPALTSVWFAVVAAGAVTGVAIDTVGVLSSVAVVGWRALPLASTDFAVIGAYWGLVQGWIPALIATRRRTPATPEETASGPRLRWVLVAVVLTLVLTVVAGASGSAATQQGLVAEQEAQRQAEGGPAAMGAAPDPAAGGEPVPPVAPSAVPRDPSWCTPEQATLLSGMEDAATGHRVFSVRLMNFSEESCVVDGYPDIAFGDQNGHELDVDIQHGSSFMAADAGAAAIEIPAGGYAIAHFGWDANATDGALIATTVYAAQVAGDVRGSWPVTLDIVEGSTVEVTAWELDERGPVADSAG